MKRFSIVTVLVLVGVLALASTAFALVSGPPTDDAWVDASALSYNTTTFILQSSYGPGGTCDVISTGYMKWDLSSMAQPAGYVSLRMRLTGTTAAGDSTTVSLYSVANDAWTETTVGGVKPSLGTLLTSTTVNSSTPLNTDITFPSTPPFVNFINGEAAIDPAGTNDNMASIGIKISSCTTSATVRLGTKENAAQPYLDARTDGPPPTAVEMRTASATRTSWPLYAGLGALALVVVAGVVVTRRKTA